MLENLSLDGATNSPGLATTAPSNAAGAWQGGLTVGGVDLVAMVVSDAGISSSNPEWWNASPLGCFFISLQPRGGWQLFQRAAQWGSDRWAKSF